MCHETRIKREDAEEDMTRKKKRKSFIDLIEEAHITIFDDVNEAAKIIKTTEESSKITHDVPHGIPHDASNETPNEIPHEIDEETADQISHELSDLLSDAQSHAIPNAIPHVQNIEFPFNTTEITQCVKYVEPEDAQSITFYEAIVWECISYLNGTPTSIRRISEATGISQNTIKRCLNSLESKGIITKKIRINIRGHFGFVTKAQNVKLKLVKSNKSDVMNFLQKCDLFLLPLSIQYT